MIRLLLGFIFIPFILLGQLIIGILKLIGFLDIFGGRKK